MARRFRLPDLKNPLSRRRFIIYLLMAGALLIVFTISMFGAAAPPRACTNLVCHSMKPEFNTWKKSAHANITCIACHTKPGGAFTKIAEDVFINSLIGVKQFVGFEKPINPESKVSQEYMEPERCFRCHNIKTRKFTPREGILMSSSAHQKHLKKGLACTTCHNRVTHKEAENYEPLKTWIEEERKEKGVEFRYKNFLKMTEGCTRCHSIKPRFEELTPELKEIAKKAPRECTTCHPADWKKLPVGHGKGWRSQHKQVASQNFNYCFTCHEEGKRFTYEGKIFCLACHDDEAVAKYRNAAQGQPI